MSLYESVQEPCLRVTPYSQSGTGKLELLSPLENQNICPSPAFWRLSYFSQFPQRSLIVFGNLICRCSPVSWALIRLAVRHNGLFCIYSEFPFPFHLNRKLK